jgi:hypothetical protein
MQFSKYLLAFVLSSVLAEATEHPSLSTRKETPSQQISTKSATIHYYEAPKPTLKDEDYEYDHEEEEHNRTTTTHGTTTSFATGNLAEGNF